MIVELTQSEMLTAQQMLSGLNVIASSRARGLNPRSIKTERNRIFRAAGIDTRKWHGAVRFVWLVHTCQISLTKRRT